MTARVLIVGAGPAGASLAYLLARRGVNVTLLEKHTDFARAFRGEGLQPSGVEAFAQMGLADRLDRLPQTHINTVEMHQHGRLSVRIQTDKLGFVARMVPQPPLLEMLTTEAARFPNFRFEMGVTARELLRENGRVVGMRADTVGESRQYRADLVIGTDGRHSVTRHGGGFQELHMRQGFDVLWVKVPMPAYWNPGTARLELGDGCFSGVMPGSDGLLQIGFTIPKGGFKELRALGTDAWTTALINRLSPDLAAHVRAHHDAVAHGTLLDVIVGRLTEWTAPGLLLLGDAAHPMSPIGGQGVNLALRDALVAANHLVPALHGETDVAAIDAAARRVVAERLPEIVAMQEHQDSQAKLFLEPGFMGRMMLRLLPVLTDTGVLLWLMGRRMRAMKYGVAEVRLAA